MLGVGADQAAAAGAGGRGWLRSLTAGVGGPGGSPPSLVHEFGPLSDWSIVHEAASEMPRKRPRSRFWGRQPSRGVLGGIRGSAIAVHGLSILHQARRLQQRLERESATLLSLAGKAKMNSNASRNCPSGVRGASSAAMALKFLSHGSFCRRELTSRLRVNRTKARTSCSRHCAISSS